MLRFLLLSALLLPWLPGHGAPLGDAPPIHARDQSGEVIDLSGPQRPTIVLFWATWCPFCKSLMPHLQSIVDERGSDAIEVLALSIFEDADADPAAELAERGLTFRVVVDADADAERWGVKGTPGLFLVDGMGRVVWHLGMVDEGQRLAGIEGRHARAARLGPLWAAQLRAAIDTLD